MLVRRAEEKDIPRILELLVQVNLVHYEGRPDLFKPHTKYTAEQLKEILKDESRPIFVCVNEEDLVMGYGFCVFEYPDPENHALAPVTGLYIDDIGVDEVFRGQHVATAVYRHIVDFARAAGVYHITLNVWELNDGARKFYEAMGMKPLKTSMETIL